MRLSDLNPGQSATITKVNKYGDNIFHTFEMGFVRILKNSVKYIAIGALLMFTVEGVSAQNFRTNSFDGTLDQMGQPPSVGTNPFDNPDGEGQEGQRRDTVPRAPRKPLESYFFDHHTRSMPNFSWNISMSSNEVTMRDIDTMLYEFQVDMPFQRIDVGSAYLGYQPQASIPLDYFERPDCRPYFAFMLPFDAFMAYILTPENVPFYNVKRPYTLLEYIQTGSEASMERDLRVIHAQNINPSTGFNVYFYNPTTRGQYNNSGAADMHLSLGFSHTGKRYSVHGGYIYNYIRSMENGGLAADSLLGRLNEYELARNLPVRLNDAQNRAVGNTFYVVQSYGVPLRRLTADDFTMADVPAFYVGNSLEYTRWGRVYRDTWNGSIFADKNGNDVNYYDQWLLNPVATRDTIGEDLFSAKLFVQMQPWDRDAIVGTLNVGVQADVRGFAQFHPEDYLTGKISKDYTQDYFLYGSVTGRFRRYFDWQAFAQANVAGEFESSAAITLSPYFWGHEVAVEGTASYRRNYAPYWYGNYYSNHFRWENEFDAENETRFGASLTIPDLGFSVGAQQNISNGKFYMDAQSMPAQFGGTLSVSGIYLREDITLWKTLHFNHRVLLQWSDNHTVVPVPLVSAYLSYFAEFDLVRDVLRLKIGVDGRYTTKYMGFGYNPALGMFYNQNEVEVGGYPMLDAYVVAKWKTMRIFFSVQHINENWFNIEPAYFSTAHYPQNRRTYKFGVSWTLYN